jgi:hypothetical protein
MTSLLADRVAKVSSVLQRFVGFGRKGPYGSFQSTWMGAIVVAVYPEIQRTKYGKILRIASREMNAICYCVAAATLLSAPLRDSWATASEMTGESSKHPILPAPVVFNSTAGDGQPLRLMLRVGREDEA